MDYTAENDFDMRKLSASSLTYLCGLSLLLLLFCAPECRALPTNNFLDRMIDVYQSKTVAWEGILRNFALRLFWILAALEFTWSAIKLALKGADLTEFFAALFNRILYVGFFLTLLLNSSAWSKAIVDSFLQAGSDASVSAGGVGGIAPSNVLDAGWLILKQIVASMSLWDPGDSLIIALAAIVILIAFALTTALLIIALVESYFVISSGVLLMGFGGSQWTNQFAINTIRYAVSVGAKLFMVQLVIGVGQAILYDWVTQMQTGNFAIDDVLMIAAASIVFLTITKVIPDMVQALINGSSLATGAALSGMIATAVGAMAAGTAGLVSGGAGTMTGAAATGAGAYNLASERLKSDPDSQRRSRLSALTGEALKGTVAHIGNNLGQRFRGEMRYGNMGAQIGFSMNQEAAILKERREAREKEQSANGTTATSSNSGKTANRLYAQTDDEAARDKGPEYASDNR